MMSSQPAPNSVGERRCLCWCRRPVAAISFKLRDRGNTRQFLPQRALRQYMALQINRETPKPNSIPIQQLEYPDLAFSHPTTLQPARCRRQQRGSSSLRRSGALLKLNVLRGGQGPFVQPFCQPFECMRAPDFLENLSLLAGILCLGPCEGTDLRRACASVVPAVLCSHRVCHPTPKTCE